MRIELEGGPLDMRIMTVPDTTETLELVASGPEVTVRWTYKRDVEDPDELWYLFGSTTTATP